MRMRSVAQICSVVVLSVGVHASGQWLQWGGPGRDFKVDGSQLSATWPDGGPKKIWERPLGEGYSSIVVDGEVLFTMYRAKGQERVIALSAADGKTRWEHYYDYKPPKQSDTSWGHGPHATPTVHAGHVYTFGFGGMLTCLKANGGAVVWRHDLAKDFGVPVPYFGHAASPIVYGKTLIVLAGGKGQGAIAFDLASGELVWKCGGFEPSYGSPILARIAGQEQLVAAVSGQVVGIDPARGKLLWNVEHKNQWDTNLMTPVIAPDGGVFVSNHSGGGRCWDLSRSGDKVDVKERWFDRKIEIAHCNAVHVNGTAYGASGETISFLSAIDLKTGKVLWKEREFNHTNLVHVGGDRFVLLDQEGRLALADLTPKELKVRAETQLFDGRSWTAPTIVSGRLFARDLKQIVALELQ